jgi:hypothetical protein
VLGSGMDVLRIEVCMTAMQAWHEKADKADKTHLVGGNPLMVSLYETAMDQIKSGRHCICILLLGASAYCN